MSIKGLNKEYIDSLIEKLKNANWVSFSEENQYFIIGFKNNNSVIKIWKSKNGYTIWTNVPNEMSRIISGEVINNKDFEIVIEIDDSGWGSPLGSTCIGFYNVKTTEYESHFLPIESFKIPGFANKQYLIETSNIIQEYLESKNYDKIKDKVLIKICTGYIFSKAVTDLYEQKYIVKRSKIEGKLQDLIEITFNKHIEDIIHKYNNNFTINANPEPTVIERKLSFNTIIGEIKKHKELLIFAKIGWKFFQENINQFK